MTHALWNILKKKKKKKKKKKNEEEPKAPNSAPLNPKSKIQNPK